MTYQEQARSGRSLASGSSNGVLASLLLVLGTVLFLAVFGNGEPYAVSDPYDSLTQSVRAPQNIADWRGNSAHIPAAE
ncbi:MAG: hypothetical protein KDK03_09955 [Rhodobacteraceae bacterium]|uniref:hypothetical protein n=1 Tax=Amaricoccus sp. B4 TaxID=3368557 RepID=UPI0013A693DE|nr:hypothetical protein [Paracoccaceae bacterium]